MEEDAASFSAKIKEAFRAADANQNGYLSRDELSRIFRNLGDWDDEEFEQLFIQADRQGDGQLDYDEFVDWVMGAGGAEVLPGVRYVLGQGHEHWPEDKKAAIVAALDAACATYNKYGSFDKEIVACWNPDVPTADANIRGNMRFGGQIGYRTALHEIAHTLGVGTHHNWRLRVDQDERLWKGPIALSKFRELVGSEEVLHADAMHFWPYGLNFEQELSGEEDARRHVELVHAFVEDLRDGEWDPVSYAKNEIGIYFQCPGSDTIFWSKSWKCIRKDVAFSMPDGLQDFFGHRKVHGLPQDLTHIERMAWDPPVGDHQDTNDEDLNDEEYSFECGDYDTVDIGCAGKSVCVIKAEYNGRASHDVTDKIRNLVHRGRIYVVGGLWREIGDPEPGISKTFKCVFKYEDLVKERTFKCGDLDTVDVGLPGQTLTIIKATYGRTSQADVTDGVRALISDGRVHIQGGIWRVAEIGDPEPGVSKTFRVVYTVTDPRTGKDVDERVFVCGDYDTVDFGCAGKVLTIIKATYGGSTQTDVTDGVRSLISDGRVNVTGGIWRCSQVGDPEPGASKTFRVIYTVS
eukprot:TRINITY_DN76332_c0_g1_i1.p1 TRINITY_DN76332_c0_g1~~TRINITY_DN76332_c0_g1_i1.p1  ORF type:complete len:576 (-),score=77.58 TRINITY_DN76332_c0_g1_i1:13-1740(-)